MAYKSLLSVLWIEVYRRRCGSGEKSAMFSEERGVGGCCPVVAGRERAGGGMILRTFFPIAQSVERTLGRQMTANSWRRGEADWGLFRRELKSGSGFLA